MKATTARSTSAIQPVDTNARNDNNTTNDMVKKEATAPRVPKFLRCLYDILYREDQTILSWAKDGTHFQIFSIPRLQVEVLPKYFKHGKFASFQRQLNNFGFRKWTKTQSNVCTFSHHFYVNCHPERLAELVAQHTDCTHTKPGVVGAAPNAPRTAQHGKRKRSNGPDAVMYSSPTKKSSIMSYISGPPGYEYTDSAMWDMVADVTSLDWSARSAAMMKGGRSETPTSATGVADLRFDFVLEDMDDFLPTSWPAHRELETASFDSRLLCANYGPSCVHVTDPTTAWDNDAPMRNEMDFFVRDIGCGPQLMESTTWGARHAL